MLSVSVCLFVSTAKTAKLIEMLLGKLAQLSPRNHVLDGSPGPTRGKAMFGFAGPIKKHGAARKSITATVGRCKTPPGRCHTKFFPP